MDGRRHSVDIPISKALIALKRVRSLRDPSTNSMTKFTALFDNLNWETNSTNDITLGFADGCEGGGICRDDVLGSKDLCPRGKKEERINDEKLNYSLKNPMSKLRSCDTSGWVKNSIFASVRNIDVDESNLCQSNQEVAFHDEALRERYCNNIRDKELDLTSILPASDCLEGVGSCDEPTEGSLQAGKIYNVASKRKFQCRKEIRSSKAGPGDVMSRTISPCLSISGAPLEGSSHGTSLYGNEDADVLDIGHHGCGLSCCWSRTPRFKGSNLLYDLEDQLLLSGRVSEPLLSEQRKGWKPSNQEITTYSESPRSLSQKFRPKFFNELAGQNVLVSSLLSAISNGRISPLYLFHGSRGTGKTSASRIFAAALNCLSLEENKPCGLCRECVLFFSGRSRDINEVDSVRINRTERVRYLIKNATTPPVSSRFKVFIIDECQLLQGPTWATVLSNLEALSQHVVFVMVTPDLDKLPRSAVSRSQRYHFPKIKEADIVTRLGKICEEEGFDYDQVALDFIATKSNGSLRDAEMLLEQLSLLSRKITMPLAYELIGIVSDDELLDLLDLALSSDASNTVRRARELMRSRIDPMQLILQLANLIMDVLSAKCMEGNSEVKRKFLERHTSVSDLQQLSNALKILSETEKQLRMSKNQTTWLNVALLQLSSAGSFSDANDSRLWLRKIPPRDGEFCSTSSPGESLKHLVACGCDNNDSCKFGMHDKGTLQSIWIRATEVCESLLTCLIHCHLPIRQSESMLGTRSIISKIRAAATFASEKYLIFIRELPRALQDE